MPRTMFYSHTAVHCTIIIIRIIYFLVVKNREKSRELYSHDTVRENDYNYNLTIG